MEGTTQRLHSRLINNYSQLPELKPYKMRYTKKIHIKILVFLIFFDTHTEKSSRF